jgi:hypothetical protein
MIWKATHFTNNKRLRMKVVLIAASFLMLSGCDRYDTYSECMYEWEITASVAESMCPGCNDWRKLSKKAVDRCDKYTKPWEM